MPRDKLLLSVLAALTLALGSLSPALAKTVGMGSLSRSQVESACNRAGGSAFGILDETAPYGCSGPYAVVHCTPDSDDCQAVLKDTAPATGNSLDLILMGPSAKSGPTAIKPQDYRVTPAVTP